MPEFIEKIFRVLEWSLIKGILVFLDLFTAVIYRIANFSFLGESWISDWYYGMIAIALILLSMYGLYVLFTRMISDPNQNPLTYNHSQGNPVEIIKSLVIVLILMFSIPTLMIKSNELFNVLINNVDYGTTATSSTSTGLAESVLEASLFTQNPDARRDFMNTWYLESFDINKKSGGDYKYHVSFIMAIIPSIMLLYNLFFLGLQIGKRVFELGLQMLIAPFVVITRFNPDSSAFSRWQRGVFSLYATTWAQILALTFVLKGIGYLNPLLDSDTTFIIGDMQFNYDIVGYVAQIVLMVAGFFFILNGPQIIGDLVGGNISSSAASKDMQTMGAVNQSLGMARDATAGSALGAYTLGRVGLKGVSKTGAVMSSAINKAPSTLKNMSQGVKSNLVHGANMLGGNKTAKGQALHHFKNSGVSSKAKSMWSSARSNFKTSSSLLNEQSDKQLKRGFKRATSKDYDYVKEKIKKRYNDINNK